MIKISYYKERSLFMQKYKIPLFIVLLLLIIDKIIILQKI